MAETSLPPGILCVTTYGHITFETAHTLISTARHNDSRGLTEIEYQMVPGGLVARARNEAARYLLRSRGQWLCFFDGDMAADPDFLERMLITAYRTTPQADVVGGLCYLRGEVPVPTIDTGTGTWESHYPGEGILPVMRTGGACLLIKRHVLEKLGDPWFTVRSPFRALDFMQELDTFARTRFDGDNPLKGEAWDALLACAYEDPSSDPKQFQIAEVGEDSGFSDKVTAAGFQIVVDTNIVIDHIDKRRITWRDHQKAMDERRREHHQLYGIMT